MNELDDLSLSEGLRICEDRGRIINKTPVKDAPGWFYYEFERDGGIIATEAFEGLLSQFISGS